MPAGYQNLRAKISSSLRLEAFTPGLTPGVLSLVLDRKRLGAVVSRGSRRYPAPRCEAGGELCRNLHLQALCGPAAKKCKSWPLPGKHSCLEKLEGWRRSDWSFGNPGSAVTV